MNIPRYFAVFANFLLFIWSTECASILGLFLWPVRSHYAVGSTFMKELESRGHEVTMVATFSDSTKLQNYRDIVIDNLKKFVGKSETNDGLLDLGRKNSIYKYVSAAYAGETIMKQTIKNPGFQKLLNSNANFDLIIMDVVCVEALIGLGHRFNCPVLAIDTTGVSLLTNHLVGNPAPSAYTPLIYSPYSSKMNIFQRLANTFCGMVCEFYKTYVHMPHQDQILKEYLKDVPSLEEVIYNHLSMILLNSHPSISGPLVSVPAIAHVGGFHVEKPKPLPKELQEFLDDAENGVILFSLGSILRSTDLSIETRSAILNSFTKFDVKVLWKFENESMTDIPDKLKIMKWLPQNDILAHPNIKGFITHGGLLSIAESIYNGVPIIGLPGFSDQQMNVEIAVQTGYGLTVEIIDLTEETFTRALDKIINDPKYRECARKHSRIFHDQAMKPMDKAVFWAEYIIRHGGAKHLRSPSMNLYWTQIYLVDIVFALIFLTVALFLIIRKFVQHYRTKIVETNAKIKQNDYHC